MATYENADYVRTRATAVLLEMMEETDYREIRVSELVRRAQVSRSSFYRNFTDKDDVLRQHLRHLTAQWRESLEEGPEQDLSGSLIRHFYAHRELCLLLHSSGLFWMVYDHIKEACGVNVDTPSVLAYGKAAWAGAIFGWAEEWTARGMEEPPEKIKELSAQLASEGEPAQ